MIALVTLATRGASAQGLRVGPARTGDLRVALTTMCSGLQDRTKLPPGRDGFLDPNKLKDTVCDPSRSTALTHVPDRGMLTITELQLNGINPCTLAPAIQDVSDVAGVQTVLQACHLGPQTGPLSFEGLPVLFVAGLGDYLKDAAKQTMVDYAVTGIAKRACTADASKPLDLARVLKHTCAALFPPGGLDVDSLTLSSLRGPFLEDLRDLPGHAWNLISARFGPRFPQATAMVGTVAFAIFDAVQNKAPLEVLKDLEDRIQYLPAIKCDLHAHQFDDACKMLLVLHVGVVAADEYVKNRRPLLTRWLDDAIIRFCQNHGADPVKLSGQCVYLDDSVATWKPRLIKMINAFERLAGAQAVLNDEVKDRGPAITSSPELASALHDIYAVFSEVIVEDDPAQKPLLDDGALVINLFLAGLASDGDAVRRIVIDILQSDFVTAKLSDGEKKSLTFVISIANATTRDGVKAAIEDVAAPIGTYKMKYGRGSWTVALNSFVGPRVGSQWRMAVPAGTDDHVSVIGLSAPVGLDVTLPYGNLLHTGFGVTLLDPLAMAQSTANGDKTKTDLAAAVSLGGYLRVGLFKSPFVLMLGGSWRPGLKSDEMCATAAGSQRCFDGALELTAAITIDVPIFVIH